MTESFDYVGGDDLDFVCEDGRCGSETEHSVGGASATETLAGTLVGSAFTPGSGGTLARIAVHLDDLGDCTADFYV